MISTYTETQGERLIRKGSDQEKKYIKRDKKRHSNKEKGTQRGNEIQKKRREPWSSGYGKKLTFQRSWVRIQAPYTGWTFFHIYLL